MNRALPRRRFGAIVPSPSLRLLARPLVLGLVQALSLVLLPGGDARARAGGIEGHLGATDFEAPDPRAGEKFGNGLAVGVDLLVVGASGGGWGESAEPGRAFVYERESGSWSLRAVLSRAAGRPGDEFGGSIAVSDDGAMIAIGARRAAIDPDGPRTGLVAIYRRPADGVWRSTDRPDSVLVPLDARDGDLCGAAIAFDERALLAGAPGADLGVEDAGAAYVYTPGPGAEWHERQRLEPPVAVRHGHFGLAVALDVDHAAVSAPNVYWHTDPGSVHVFQRDLEDGGWDLAASIDGRRGEIDGDHLGRALHFADGPEPGERTLLVGASGMNRHAGAILVYRHDSGTGAWREDQYVVPEGLDLGDHFGFSLDVRGRHLVVGAIWDDRQMGVRTGAAYHFMRRGDGTWVTRQRVEAMDPEPDESFGFRLGIVPGSAAGPIEVVVTRPNRDGDGIIDAGAATAWRPGAGPGPK